MHSIQCFFFPFCFWKGQLWLFRIPHFAQKTHLTYKVKFGICLHCQWVIEFLMFFFFFFRLWKRSLWFLQYCCFKQKYPGSWRVLRSEILKWMIEWFFSPNNASVMMMVRLKLNEDIKQMIGCWGQSSFELFSIWISITPTVLQTSAPAEMTFILYWYFMCAHHILTSTWRLCVIVVGL